MRKSMFFSVLFYILVVFFLTSCTNSSKRPVKGSLEIIFTLQPSQDEKIVPSYQTVVWLENQNGEILHTLLVSEYLAYGGYNDSTICEEWNKKADWGNATEELFDAVTQATPPRDETTTIPVDCKALQLLPGTYFYCVETHIMENHNILYKGEITLGNEPASSTASQVNIPPDMPENVHVLTDVKAQYKI